MADDPSAGYLVAFGGATPWQPASDYTLSYANGTWWNLTGSVSRLPPPRYGGAMAYDPVDGEEVLFGGCLTSSCYPALGDTWVFANGTWTQVTGTSPSPRGYAGLTWDYSLNALILFGGLSGTASSTTSYFNDTWSFVGGHWTNLTAGLNGSAPEARAGMGFASSPDTPPTVFGGIGATLYSDTWELEDNEWTNVTTSAGTGPTPRHNMMFAGDVVNGSLVLFGGYFEGQYLHDTWLYRAGAWSLLTTSGPPGTTQAGFAWDSEIEAFVMYGGAISVSGQTGTTNAVWTLRGDAWSLLNPAPKSPFPWILIAIPAVILGLLGLEVWVLGRRRRNQLKQLSALVPEPAADSIRWFPTLPVGLVRRNYRRSMAVMYAVLLPVDGILVVSIFASSTSAGTALVGVLPLLVITLGLPALISQAGRSSEVRQIGIFEGGVVVARNRETVRIPWDYLQPPNTAPKGPLLQFHYTIPGRQQIAGGFPATYDQTRAILGNPHAVNWTVAPPVRALLYGVAMAAPTDSPPSGGAGPTSIPAVPLRSGTAPPPPSTPTARGSPVVTTYVPPAPSPQPASSNEPAQLRRCPRCRSLATMSMRFCSRCGSPLQ